MSSGKGRLPRLEDYLPQTKARQAQTQTPEEAHALFSGWAAAHNAAEKRRESL